MEIGTGYTLVAENLRTRHYRYGKRHDAARRSSAVWADLTARASLKPAINSKSRFTTNAGISFLVPSSAPFSTADIRNAFLNLQLNVGDVQPKDTILRRTTRTRSTLKHGFRIS